jgi:hypothetical protein
MKLAEKIKVVLSAIALLFLLTWFPYWIHRAEKDFNQAIKDTVKETVKVECLK